MNDVIIRIKSFYPGLSKAGKRLADHILNKGDDVPFASVRELAGLAGVSVASISRFAREIGFDDFKTFKKQLGRPERPPLGNIYQPVNADDSADTLIEKVFSGNAKSIEETLQMVNRAEMIRAAGLIADTSRLIFFGMGSSGNVAMEAALRFAQIDVQAEAYLDSYQILTQVLRMKKGEIAFGISHSGRSVMTVRAMELARRNGVTTMGISNFIRSPLRKASDIFFCTVFPESRILTAALSSVAAQTCIIDALYLIAAGRSKKWLNRSELFDRKSEEQLRLPMNTRIKKRR